MGLSNHVTYEGRLECAHQSVAVATLKLNMEDLKQQLENEEEWLNKALDPKTSVLLINTADVSCLIRSFASILKPAF